MKFTEFPHVKITTKNCSTELLINGFKMPYVTGINASWDNSGRVAKITIDMWGNIELDADSEVTLNVEDTGAKYGSR